jgi:hypothetical protein
MTTTMRMRETAQITTTTTVRTVRVRARRRVTARRRGIANSLRKSSQSKLRRS